MMTIPDIVENALEPGEIVKWIGKPQRIPKFYLWFFGIFVGFLVLALLQVILTGKGIRNSESGKVSTPQESIGFLLFFMACIGAFYYVWKRQFNKIRYIVTNKRAFIYRSIWGASWTFNLGSKKMERDYADPEYSPISGGYFTPETVIERTGTDQWGTLTVASMRSEMDDARAISKIKSIFPSLDKIIYDPSNLMFIDVANPKMAELEIKAAVKSYQSGLKTRATP